MAASGKGSALTGLLLARRRRRRGTVDLLVRSKVGDAAPAVFDDLIFSVTPPTLYYVVYPSAESEPSATQIKAGQKQSGAAATASGSETARTTTGEEVFAAAASGLTGGTSYKTSFVWSDGTNDSNVVTSAEFTTLSAGATIAVPAAGLTLSGQAPTVTASDHKSVVVPTGALSLTGYAPDVSVSAATSIAVPAASITLTGPAPSVAVSAHQVVSVPVAGASVTGHAPTVAASAHVAVEVPAAAIGATAYAPSVLAGGSAAIQVPAAALSITAYAPSVVADGSASVVALKPAGRPRYRRVILGERLYSVLERDVPALLEAELFNRAPPATAEVIEGPKPRRKRAKRAPQPVKTVAQVQRAVQHIKRRIGPDDVWLMQALETVAQRVLERLQDEEDSLMLLLAA